jgi:LacI family transcriptional regulator
VPIDTVAIDGAGAAKAATAYLISKGHRRIAMLAGEPGSRANMRRTAGYQEALQEAGIGYEAALVRTSDFTELGGFAATDELLTLSSRPSAIFATNDLLALGALSCLRQNGLHVPDDMAIIGFDDIPYARLVDPPLTTIAQFPERLGARAAQLLLERISGEGPPEGRHETLPFELIVRQSA